MEAAVEASGNEPEARPVLGYQATQQRRWERGIKWLSGIVCVTQLLTVPAGVLELVDFVISGGAAWDWSNHFQLIADLLVPIVSISIAVCGFLLLLHVPRARGAMIACTCTMVLVWAIRKIVILLAAARLSSGYYDQRGGLAHVAEMIVWCYPPALLSVVLKGREGTVRYWSASAIWWMTASAAVLVGAPVVVLWLFDFVNVWGSHALAVFSAFLGYEWWQSLYGIGMIANSMACFSVIGAVAWTLYRGKSGRWAIMITAALWILYAVAFFGTRLGEKIVESVRTIWMSATFEIVNATWPAEALRNLAMWLAFPLALRVALTLSDVRAKLEGKSLKDASEK